jgi:large exoprotein involved in heme utilization and adhesion
LQFNGLTNGAISISRSLVFVPTGRTLALVGGDVNMQEAGLFANSGRVELGSVAGNGFVAIAQTANNLILNYNQVSNLGNISLDQSAINVSGANFDGNIQLQGRQVTLDNSSVLGAILFSSGNGGEIFVRATEFLSVRDSTVFSLAVTPFLPGNGSNIIINTNNLLLDGGQLLTDSDFNSIGNAGNIEITAKNVSLVSNDSLSRRSIISSGGIINFAGNSGDIKITTDNLLLTDGAAVTANSRGIGNGGVVDITAKSIFLDGSNSLFPSQIASSSFGDGNAGDVKISTESLVLKDGGQINVETESNKGNAGKISIRSNFIDIFGENSTYRSGLFANALVGSGSGGNIEVVNSDRLIVRDGGAISASNFDDRSRTSLITPGTGILGNITINSSSILLNQGNINIDSLGFSQGNINLNSSLILLRNGSKISTNALGSAAGGNITIKADFLTAIPFENSDITATAVSNFGGKVIVSAQGVFGFQFVERLTPLSDITASSPLGASQFNGLLESSATTTLIDNYDLTSINNLSVDNPQIVSACDRLRGNEFIITGRGGVPSDASKVISSQAIWRDLRLSEIPSTQSNITSQTETNLVTTQSTRPVAIQPIPQIEAQGWEKDGNGRLKLLAYATSPSDPVWRLPAVCPVNNVRN